jgi:protein-tyrosine phosphatase
MKQITPFPLWLGHAGDGRDFQRLAAAEIEAVVQVAAEEPAYLLPREIIYCRFPILDGRGNLPALLRTAIAAVIGLLENRLSTLICCGAGRSRSPAISAAALAICHQEPPSDWLKRIAEQHPTDVSPGLWQDILEAIRPGLRG